MKNYSTEVIVSECKMLYKFVNFVYSKLKDGSINLHIENGRITITDQNDQILLSLPLNILRQLLK